MISIGDTIYSVKMWSVILYSCVFLCVFVYKDTFISQSLYLPRFHGRDTIIRMQFHTCTSEHHHFTPVPQSITTSHLYLRVSPLKCSQMTFTLGISLCVFWQSPDWNCITPVTSLTVAPEGSSKYHRNYQRTHRWEVFQPHNTLPMTHTKYPIFI